MSGAAPALRREDLPDGTARIWFSAPILHHTEPKGFVDLRPPTAGERWDLGEPLSFIYNGEGLGTPYVDRPVLKQWIGLLMVGHDIDMLGRERDLALAQLIEEVVLDFFANARRRSRLASAPSQAPA